MSLLATACGGSPRREALQPGSTTSAVSVQVTAALAFSRCMRSHGVPSFPDPDSDGNVPSPTSRALGVSQQTAVAAAGACKRLRPNGGGGGVRTPGDQKKLAFALQTARCMRSHGYPTYPDPRTSSPSSQGSGTRFAGTGIDTKSPRFQTMETNCEMQARTALGLP